MSITINDNAIPLPYVKLVAPVPPLVRYPYAHGERRGHPDLSQHSNKRGRRSAGPVPSAVNLLNCSEGEGLRPRTNAGARNRIKAGTINSGHASSGTTPAQRPLADPWGGSCGPDHVGRHVDMWF